MSYTHISEHSSTDKIFSLVASPNTLKNSARSWNSSSGGLMVSQAKRVGITSKLVAQDAVFHPQLIDNGKARVKVLKSRDQWYGVTYKEDKDSVVSALQAMKDKGLYPEILWK